LKSEKGIKIIFIAGIALIAIIFLLSLSGGKKDSDNSAEKEEVLFEISEYESKLEMKLTEIIEKIDGTSDIHVMITLDKTEESIYGGKTSDISATITPTIRGVAVVCKGGENAVVREKVSEAVCKALGVSAARVCVTY
ncbi:MAG TPA: hypothetical protein DDX91_01030, partial [Ruminococcaceae bacterium]|nr:hypothetical protein [Oscillospiraceae bacterium]